MTRTLVLVALLVLAAEHRAVWAGERQRGGAPAGADTSTTASPPRLEVFGGYLYSPEFDEYKPGSAAGQGWAAALGVNLGSHLGLMVDADWQSWTVQGDLDRLDPVSPPCAYATTNEFCGTYRGDQDVSLFYFSAGPRLRVRTGALTVFGLAAFEIQRSHSSEQEVGYVLTGGGVEYDTLSARTAGAWGFGLGGGADVSLGRRVALRLAQVNYSLGGFGEGPDRQLRIRTGVVMIFN